MIEQGKFFHGIVLSKRTVTMKYNGFFLCVMVIVSTVCGVGARSQAKENKGPEQKVPIDKNSGFSLQNHSVGASEEAVGNGGNRTSGKEGNQKLGKSEGESSGDSLKISSPVASTADGTTVEHKDPNLSGVKNQSSTEKTADSKVSKGELEGKAPANVKNIKLGAKAESSKNAKNVTSASNEESMATKTTAAMESPLHDGAFLRGFYVFVGIGIIVVVFFALKGLRLRQHRAARRYKVLPYRDDQEMFPLAADDDEDDEEIFNAIPRN